MLRFINWTEAADLILSSLIETISQGVVTYDLARQLEGAKKVTCSGFSRAIQKNILDK